MPKRAKHSEPSVDKINDDKLNSNVAESPESLRALISSGTDGDIVALYGSVIERAAIEVFGIEPEVCILDVETTGLNPGRDAIIEIAIARMQGSEVLEEYSTFVNPGRQIPEEITELTGISQKDVSTAPTIEEITADIRAFIGESDIVAHNARFDRSFVERATGALPGSWIDTVTLSHIGFPRLKSHRQQDLVAAFAPHLAGGAHRAINDVRALCGLWRVILCSISMLPPTVIRALAEIAPPSEWPEGRWIGRVADLYGTKAGSSFDVRKLRETRVHADKADELWDAWEKDLTYLDTEEVAEAFSATGLAGTMYPGFEPRAEQVTMACEICDAFKSGQHLAVEAGTGVGKSLAYLVPAAKFAEQNSITIGVATKSNTLTDQLMYSELPKLNEALGGTLRYTALKGYDHYPCLRKVDSQLREKRLAPREIATLIAWIAQSSWADLDSLNMYMTPLTRSLIQANAADCTKRRCRYFNSGLCYVHGARRRAKSSHIVVTNHALLFRDAVAQGGILPPIRFWIIDEAHGAEQEARRQLSICVDEREMNNLLRLLAAPNSGMLTQLKRESLKTGTTADDIGSSIAQLQGEIDRLATLSESFFSYVGELREYLDSPEYDVSELWINEPIRNTATWGAITTMGSSLRRAIEDVVTRGRTIITHFESALDQSPNILSDFMGALFGLVEAAGNLDVLVSEPEENLVYSAVLKRRATPAGSAVLQAQKLDVGPQIAEELFSRATSVVFTSATIAAGSSFSRFARGVGLTAIAEDKWHALQLPSSYPLERQMKIYIPSDIPEPSMRTYLPALERFLEDIHRAMQGGVLTLFTNNRDMDELYRNLKPRLEQVDVGLISQSSRVSRKALTDQFVASHTLSLFATKSFWEGFDAQGDTLRAVVIPKLPFGRPTEPLTQARGLVDGAATWNRYSLPDAIIELKQAVGRLIRSSADEGCIVIADARLLSKGYGKKVLAALPVTPTIATTDEIIEDIRQTYQQ